MAWKSRPSRAGLRPVDRSRGPWSLYIFMLIGRRTSFAERPTQKGPWPGRAAMLAAVPESRPLRPREVVTKAFQTSSRRPLDCWEMSQLFGAKPPSASKTAPKMYKLQSPALEGRVVRDPNISSRGAALIDGCRAPFSQPPLRGSRRLFHMRSRPSRAGLPSGGPLTRSLEFVHFHAFRRGTSLGKRPSQKGPWPDRAAMLAAVPDF